MNLFIDTYFKEVKDPLILEKICFLDSKISIDPPLKGWENMQRDKENYLSCKDMEANDFKVRIYEWINPTISLGISQNPQKIINFSKINDRIEIVSRITGGRSVLHFKEITYSVTAPVNSLLFGRTLLTSYEKISNILITFLEDLGIKAKVNTNKPVTKSNSAICYDLSGQWEIELNEQKLIGSAQKRGKNGFLQHGSIPYKEHKNDLAYYLNDEVLPKKEVNYVYLSHYLSHKKDLSLKVVKEILKKTFIKLMIKDI